MLLRSAQASTDLVSRVDVSAILGLECKNKSVVLLKVYINDMLTGNCISTISFFFTT